jgi:MtN3 and saliva related transmembrane protein
MATEFIGWSAAIVLLVTIARQVYSQWRDRSHLQLVFKNWVFLVTNLLMLGTALLGQWIYLHNKRHQKLAQ